MISGAAAGVVALSQSTSGLLGSRTPNGESMTAAFQPGSMVQTPPVFLDPKLVRRALSALDQHSKAIVLRDRIAIVDFLAPSSEARLHFLDVGSGEPTRLCVAHGTGSDPQHTGFLQTFSNAFGSNASSEGAFLTDDYYVGKHGRSQPLVGLDPTNNNARDRAIVIHGAWYANADMVQEHGKLGRSQGCFAVGENDLANVFGYLGKGRLLFAASA
jgi:hypothetical protein